MAMNALDQHIV